MVKQSSQKNYQKLKQELDEVLLALQSQSTDIDEAIRLHKKGQVILAQLEEYLKQASLQIDEISGK